MCIRQEQGIRQKYLSDIGKLWSKKFDRFRQFLFVIPTNIELYGQCRRVYLEQILSLNNSLPVIHKLLHGIFLDVPFHEKLC